MRTCLTTLPEGTLTHPDEVTYLIVQKFPGTNSGEFVLLLGQRDWDEWRVQAETTYDRLYYPFYRAELGNPMGLGIWEKLMPVSCGIAHIHRDRGVIVLGEDQDAGDGYGTMTYNRPTLLSEDQYLADFEGRTWVIEFA